MKLPVVIFLLAALLAVPTGVVLAQDSEAGTVEKAELVSPTPGSTLPGGTVTFTWTAGQNVWNYFLKVGTSPGGKEYFRSGVLEALSAGVTNLATDGSPIYVRLYSRFQNGWEFTDYEFTAGSAPSGG